MKEIKAYLRPQFADLVVEALEKEGARDLTLIHADAFAAMATKDGDGRPITHKYAEQYAAVVKLELVCRDEKAARFVEVIRQHSYTGQHGDGRVFVATVDEALNIRTGATGVEAL